MAKKSDKKSCGIEGCKRSTRAKGYCDYHYKKWKRGELPHPRYKTCVQEGCRKKRFAAGLCGEHYNAVHGKKEAPIVAAAVPEPAPEAVPP